VTNISVTRDVTYYHVILRVALYNVNKLLRKSPSLEHCLRMSHTELERSLNAAHSLRSTFQGANLQLLKNISEFSSYKFDSDDGLNSEDIEPKDPAIVASDVVAQIVCSNSRTCS
jgi:hypothetical protein